MTNPPRKPVDLTQRPTVRVKPRSYQPSKAEKETPVGIVMQDGSAPTEDEFLERVLRPVNLIEDPDD